jgi:hypothetical protein
LENASRCKKVWPRGFAAEPKVHYAIIGRGTKDEAEVKRAKTNAAGPATQPHRSLLTLVLPSRRHKRRDDGTGPTALTRSATFTKYWLRSRDSENRVPATLCDAPVDQPAHRAGTGGGRNAWATSTRSRAFSDCPLANSPSRIANLPPASPQSSFSKR